MMQNLPELPRCSQYLAKYSFSLYKAFTNEANFVDEVSLQFLNMKH